MSAKLHSRIVSRLMRGGGFILVPMFLFAQPSVRIRNLP